MARGNEAGEVTERNRLMNKHAITAQPISPIPPDDLQRKLAVARPNENEKLPHIALMGDTYTVLLSGDDTDGRYCLIDMLIPPGGGPGPHRHDFEESFTILEGEIETTFRGKKSVVRAGETINIPANAPHSFRNASQNPVRPYAFARQPDKRSSLQRSALPWRPGQPLHPRSMRPRKMSSSRKRKTSRPSTAPSC